MAILAIDTAAGQCAAGLLLPDGKNLSRIQPGLRGQSELLLPMIENLLQEAQIDYTQLTAVAVTTGPGSFTGLRVGLAVAQGLALALAIPAVGVTSFEAFAAANQSDLPAMVLIESRRSEIYWAVVDAAGASPGSCDMPEAIAAQIPAQPFVLLGDATHCLEAFLGHRSDILIRPAPNGPDPLAIAKLAQTKLADGNLIAAPLPVYIRPPDAKAAGQK